MDVRGTRSWMPLLSKYPGPEAVVQAEKDAKDVLRTASRGTLSAARIEEVIGASRGSLGVPMTSAERVALKELVEEIQRQSKKVEEIDRQVATWAGSNHITQLMAGPLGPAATAALVAYVGATSDYASSAAYEKACGLNLKVRSSGKHQGQLKITKRGPPRVRQLLYLAALRLCESDETVRAWYQQRASYKANTKTKAVVAVMRKLVRAVWSMTHDVEHPKAFDSRRLFDTRRLSTHSSRVANELPQSSCPPAQTSKRTGRNLRSRKPSALEAHP